tara:strand:+ start:562 stop:921 length:360 start_codon:yes stop_codon:yes gene_type:complete
MSADGLNNFNYTRNSTYRLVGLDPLMDMLGYTSTKGLCRWLQKYEIPVVKLGRNSFVLAEHIDRVIEAQLGPSVETLSNKSASLRDTNRNSNITKDASGVNTVQHSDAAQTFLDNVKKI